jgi:hypothetical protein
MTSALQLAAGAALGKQLWIQLLTRPLYLEVVQQTSSSQQM